MHLDGSQGVLFSAGEGETVTEEPARTVVIKTAHPLVDVTWSRYEPGERGPEPHIHERHVDSFFVLKGELLFELGGSRESRIVAPGGTFAAVPPRVVHTFGNEGSGTASFLNVHAPSCGFADSLRDRAVDFDTADPPPGGGRDPGDAIVCRSDGGERYGRGDTSTTILADLPELSVMLVECGPGFAVAPHAHDDHLDAFFLLDGDVEFTVGGHAARVRPAAWTAAPPHVVHGFRNVGSRRARLLNFHAPDAGFAASIRRRYS
jgi:quercetin dioxygenase-like cupin family protein